MIRRRFVVDIVRIGCKAAGGSVWSNAVSAMPVAGLPSGFGKTAPLGFLRTGTHEGIFGN